MTDVAVAQGEVRPVIREVTLDAPWEWLAAGWRDLLTIPRISLAYGAVFVVVSAFLTLGLWHLDMLYLLPPFTGGFMLVAPTLCFGLYESSRRLAQGEQPSFRDIFGALDRARGQISLMTGMLILLFYLWLHMALLIFLLFHGMAAPDPGNFIEEVFFHPRSVAFLVIGTGAGLVIAGMVFAISAVSIPMLLDRDVGVVNAVQTSVNAVTANWKPMLLWAFLIVSAVTLGIATLYIGLAVTVPLIAHATWHAYKGLVDWR
ncbi:MAG: DUF2189 domain-containing protein [Alphaproteobacteria bacterium]|nr:DUF2189 domain-containing protein [Alphaproteobacteria bacterium]